MRLPLPALTIKLLILMFVVLPAGAQDSDLTGLAGQLARAINKTSKHPSAVVDFTDLQGNVTLAGRFFAEEMETALENSGVGIDLVDRTRLQLILQENKLASKEGLIDPATARKLGNIAGVQVLITGTITPLGDAIRLSVKALDTEDARVLAAVSTNVHTTPAIAQLLGQGTISNPEQPQTPKLQSLDYHQYRFDLLSCDRTGNTIECNFSVTDRSGDQDLSVFANCSNSTMRSRLIDTQGREIVAKVISMGSHQNPSWGCIATSTLVSGTGARATLTFEGVPADVVALALLEITCHEGSDPGFEFGQRFRIQFRNVPVSQKKY